MKNFSPLKSSEKVLERSDKKKLLRREQTHFTQCGGARESAGKSFNLMKSCLAMLMNGSDGKFFDGKKSRLLSAKCNYRETQNKIEKTLEMS